MIALQALQDRPPALSPVLLIPFTYSSALENGRLRPSRLSRLAFDAAGYHAQAVRSRGHDVQMLLAGEQSYSTHETTTAQALLHQAEHRSAHVLHDPENRLLNTVFQVEAIAGWMADNPTPGREVTTVAWGFHEDRIRETYGWHGIASEFVRVEEVIDQRWDQSPEFRARFRTAYGFSVDWPRVRARALPAFNRREVYTRLAGRIGRGALLKLWSSATGRGRYDDIAPTGSPVRASTY